VRERERGRETLEGGKKEVTRSLTGFFEWRGSEW